MDQDYHVRVLNGANPQERAAFLEILKERPDYFRSYLQTGALTFEYPHWQITLYSEQDLANVLCLLEGNEVGNEHYFIPPEKRKECSRAA